MATYLVNDEDLTGIADAIREKTGESDTLTFPADFESSVRGINLIDGVELDKKVTNMGEEGRVDCLALCGTFTNGTSSGITYTWNSDKSECTISGTSGSSISVNYFYRSPSAMPSSILPGKTYYLKHDYTQSGNTVYVQLYYFTADSSTSKLIGTYKESTVITIPSDAVGLWIRFRIANNTTVDTVVPRPKMFRVYDIDETDKYYERRDTAFSLIETRTLTDNSTDELFETESDGTPYDFSSVYVVVDCTNCEKVNNEISVRLNNDKTSSTIRYAGYGHIANPDRPVSYFFYITCGPMVFSGHMRTDTFLRNAIAPYGDGGYFMPYNIIYGKTPITNVYLYRTGSGVIPAGAVIKVYAVRTVK